MSSNVNEIWKSLKELDEFAHEEYKKRSLNNNKYKKDIIIEEKIQNNNKKNKKNEKEKEKEKNKLNKKKEEKNEKKVERIQTDNNDNNNNDHNEEEGTETTNERKIEREKIIITAQEFLKKISRDINSIESTNLTERRRSLENILNLLTNEYTLTNTIEYSELFSELSRPIFKRYADTSEKIRDLAFQLTIFFFQNATDFVPILGYYFPALLQRIPSTLAYDQELQIFVTDIESHSAYKRGRAVSREDKKDPSNPIGVIEVSEEIRLLMCQSVHFLIQKLNELNALSVLNSYFSDLILYLQSQVKDPYPEVKIESLQIIKFLAEQREYEHGMSYFSVALCRCILPHLRHRHAKVRSVAVESYSSCVQIPNREKRKGSGTETIVELIGFREENVLSIASFYQPDVSINYLAELTSDASTLVREKLVHMLSSFLTELEDRYDHQTRLLPYLLDLLGDENSNIQKVALNCLIKCGQQYENEHPDEIIERRQYGIDGDDRCNFEKPLPLPFTERPRIGIRIYVRGNTKRFLFALINELTNWQNKTRIKSAKLLKYIIILCEEYLTMEAYKLIPTYIKALGFAREDKDKELDELLCEICELSGRYFAPESYVHYILPRLRGDADVTQFGVDSLTRCCVMDVLCNMIEGSKSSLLPPLFTEIISCLIDPFVIDIESIVVHQTAIRLLNVLLSKIQGKGLAITEAHYQSTGRLKSFKESITNAFRFLFVALHKPELRSIVSIGLKYLSILDFDSRITGISGLISRQMPILLNEIIESNVIEDSSSEFKIIELYSLSPWLFLQKDQVLFTNIMDYLSSIISRLSQSHLSFSHENKHSTTSTTSKISKISTSSSSMIIQSVDNDDNNYSDLSTLLKYSQLFLSVIRPVFSLDIQLSIYYTELFNDIDNKESENQVNNDKNNSISTESCLRPNNLEFSFLENITKLFINSTKWNLNFDLENTRLEILSLLFCQQLVDGGDNSNEYDSFIKELIIIYSKDLFRYVFSTTLSPSSSIKIRQKSIEFILYIIQRFSDGNQRVISYDKRKKNQTLNVINQKEVFFTSEITSIILNLLITTSLDDSSDSIRVTTLEILLHLVPFIENNEMIENQYGSGSSSDISNSKFITFESIVDYLLHRCLDGNPTKDVLSNLDMVLRSLAILDPIKFESIVRSKIPLLCGIHKAPSDASEIFSGLIDHSSLLAQFQQLQM